MTQSPILKALSTFSTNQVQYLLMGGQACVFYGAAEFSRDCDIAVLCDAANLEKLRSALDALHAGPIAVPPFDEEFLRRGHAVHFRCRREDVDRLRIDIMSNMRGVDAFGKLWTRRTTLEAAEGTPIELMGIEDLVKAKKTQRDKDWPMIRRLVEAHYRRHRDKPSESDIGFWLRECRTPEILSSVVQENSEFAAEIEPNRPLLCLARDGDVSRLPDAISNEERGERERDRQYWEPLRNELETLRIQRRSTGNS